MKGLLFLYQLSYRKNPEKGFTVMELLVALTISSLVLMTAAPQLSVLIDSFNRQDLRQQFEFDLRRAKTEALAEGAIGIITIADTNDSYVFGIDYLPFEDPPEIETEIYTRPLPKKMTVTCEDMIIFDARGYLVDEDGELTSITASLKQDGEEFCSAEVFTSGAVEYDC